MPARRVYSSRSAGDAPGARTPRWRASQGSGLAAMRSPRARARSSRAAASSWATGGALAGVRCAQVDVVPQVGQGEPLQAVVQDAGDGPGAVHRRGGDLVDEGADVVSGELGGAEPLLQGLAGVLALVPPGFGFGEPGLDLLVDVRVQGLPDGGGPQVEQVAGSAGPVLGLADLLGGGQVAGVALQDAGEHGFGGGLLVRLVSGRVRSCR